MEVALGTTCNWLLRSVMTASAPTSATAFTSLASSPAAVVSSVTALCALTSVQLHSTSNIYSRLGASSASAREQTTLYQSKLLEVFYLMP